MRGEGRGRRRGGRRRGGRRRGGRRRGGRRRGGRRRGGRRRGGRGARGCGETRSRRSRATQRGDEGPHPDATPTRPRPRTAPPRGEANLPRARPTQPRAKPDACARRERLSRDARRPRREKTASRRARATRAPVRDAPRQTSASAADERHPRVARVATRDWRERREDSRLCMIFVRVFARRVARARRRRGSVDCSMLSSEALRSPHTHARVLSLASIARSPLTPRTPSHASARGP